MKKPISRRTVVTQLGAGAMIAGCGSDPDTGAPSVATGTPAGSRGDAGADSSSPNSQPSDSGSQDSRAADAPPPPTAKELLAGIEAIIVLVMENRSFDHFLGSLGLDTKYANVSKVAALTGNESNADTNGNPVKVFRFENFTPNDPPHDWNSVHIQWNTGKNDGFVKAHAGANERDVMGYHDRAQLPFLYWLADNYAVLDHWYASVLGPTWPNRYYLHSTSSGGRKDNTPTFTNFPDTVWDRLKESGNSYKNYHAGAIAWYTGGYVGKLLQMNPAAPMDQFFNDAKSGTLPNFSIIDPDFASSDDHPSHDIRKGQAFMASVYKALAESPQWDKLLLIITYDEHGGFFDHVAPPSVDDDNIEFTQRGFRMPALAIGGRVLRGAVVNTEFEHSSVAATLRTKFGIRSLSKRMDASNDLSTVLDPALVKTPMAPATGMPTVTMSLAQAVRDRVGVSSQPELEHLVETGAIPKSCVDSRTHEERMGVWLAAGERLGALRLIR